MNNVVNNTKNKVTVPTMSVKNEDGMTSPHIFYVRQNGLQHGYFCVDDYDTPEAAKAAAMELAEKLKATPWVSPFKQHEDIIMADYGTAAKLRRFVLSLYNGHAFPVDLSDISGMDKKHFGIVMDLMTSYRTLGENDERFMRLAERIKKEFGKTE